MKKIPLRIARKRSRKLFVTIMMFSVLVNLLVLTGPFYMLQVYDRVISSRSVETLIALTGIMVFLFTIMGGLDYIRGRIAARAGARLQSDLDGPIFRASMLHLSENPDDTISRNVQKDLEQVSRLTGSPVFLSLFDIPWIPLFLGAIFILHPVLGIVATVGGVLLVVLAIVGNWISAEPTSINARNQVDADRTYSSIQRDADIILGMGMRRASLLRWGEKRRSALLSGVHSSDITGRFAAISKTLRQILQSLILGAGAWLVILDQMSAGGMIAASVLMGRALAPVDAAIGQWGVLQRTRQSWQRVNMFLRNWQGEEERMELPRPAGNVKVEGVTTGPPGKRIHVLRNMNFQMVPGRALGVVGQSGAGKSSVAKLLMNNWQPAAGRVLLDEAPINQYDPDLLGSYIGYLPQDVRLMDGTIAQNIARFDPEATPEEIIDAAETSGAHKLILSLPDGYDTRINPEDPDLSGGQMQRIGLARALFKNPPVVILDEPNSNMDAEGSADLTAAIQKMKARGSAIMIMAHRPSAIEACDDIMVLDQGMVRVFGPKEKVIGGQKAPADAKPRSAGGAPAGPRKVAAAQKV
ncbi:MAG: type I secretion system permease/ATPase [Roseibium sp.]|uniref:type I secretion system permease/ATPase n=1 Tax=Roseibium sp. TaxID=1936156 RepID=UPI0032977C49